ncbi:hypothetical protein [Hymenobacter glacialis]|uniref:hypothetical protein n=1 Tax=Hymenobacter glacialis TaxID=1908236 RepID=UPI00138F9E14|nr:hypothetical protein [Hymenobacter glacialis]
MGNRLLQQASHQEDDHEKKVFHVGMKVVSEKVKNEKSEGGKKVKSAFKRSM